MQAQICDLTEVSGSSVDGRYKAGVSRKWKWSNPNPNLNPNPLTNYFQFQYTFIPAMDLLWGFQSNFGRQWQSLSAEPCRERRGAKWQLGCSWKDGQRNKGGRRGEGDIVQPRQTVSQAERQWYGLSWRKWTPQDWFPPEREIWTPRTYISLLNLDRLWNIWTPSLRSAGTNFYKQICTPIFSFIWTYLLRD